MLSTNDLNQIQQRGITQQQVEHQLEQMRAGFPFLRIEAAAAIGHGIMAPEEVHKVVKFVPASVAASRMFKNLFAFLAADYYVPTTDF